MRTSSESSPRSSAAALVSSQIKLGQATALKQGMRALSRGIHAMALELRARHRSGNELARCLTSTRDRTRRATARHPSAADRTKDAEHRVIYHEQRACLANRATQSTSRAHADQTRQWVDEPPQVRPLGIKRAGKATGRRSKHLDRRLPHHHNIAASNPLANASAKSSAKGHGRSPGLIIPNRDSAAGTCGGRNRRASRAGPALMPLLAAVRSSARPFKSKNPRCGFPAS